MPWARFFGESIIVENDQCMYFYRSQLMTQVLNVAEAA